MGGNRNFGRVGMEGDSSGWKGNCGECMEGQGLVGDAGERSLVELYHIDISPRKMIRANV